MAHREKPKSSGTDLRNYNMEHARQKGEKTKVSKKNTPRTAASVRLASRQSQRAKSSARAKQRQERNLQRKQTQYSRYSKRLQALEADAKKNPNNYRKGTWGANQLENARRLAAKYKTSPTHKDLKKQYPKVVPGQRVNEVGAKGGGKPSSGDPKTWPKGDVKKVKIQPKSESKTDKPGTPDTKGKITGIGPVKRDDPKFSKYTKALQDKKAADKKKADDDSARKYLDRVRGSRQEKNPQTRRYLKQLGYRNLTQYRFRDDPRFKNKIKEEQKRRLKNDQSPNKKKNQESLNQIRQNPAKPDKSPWTNKWLRHGVSGPTGDFGPPLSRDKA
tara:strand:- start:1378 stop:2370 length:993 start_codon:yes stop_codon:yes gene_type:complete